MKNTRKKLRNLSSKSNDKANKSEKLTEKDLAELMGINRDTYTRGKGGAVKRK